MAFRRGKIRERGRGNGKRRGKWIIKSRFEFPDLMFTTSDTPHGPNVKFMKKNDWIMPEKSGKKLFFSYFGF